MITSMDHQHASQLRRKIQNKPVARSQLPRDQADDNE